MNNKGRLTNEQFAVAAFTALSLIAMMDNSPEVNDAINELLNQAPDDVIIGGSIAAITSLIKVS